MSEAFLPPDEPDADTPGMAPTISDDWTTIWHSELAALAVDREWGENRELQQNWLLLVSLWSGAARALGDAAARQTRADAAGRAAGPAGTDAAAGATAAAAASDAGMAAIERLSRRVDVLERLLAGRGGDA